VKVYISVPLSRDGLVGTPDELRKVGTRAQATEMLYSDAAYGCGLAQEQWPEIHWRTAYARTGKFVVAGQGKDEE
jgi:hypothetical protein